MLGIIISLIINFISPLVIKNEAQYFPVYNPDSSIEQTVYFGPERIAGSLSLGPKLSADSAIVADKKTGQILLAKNIEQEHPIASLTKLMTTLVFLETNPDWESVIEYEPQDYAPGAQLPLRFGEQAKLVDIYRSMLVGSQNNATLMLVRSTGLDQAEFVQRMNQKASDLGLGQTHFTEPTGLSEKNVSSAKDYLKLIQAAFATQEVKAILTSDNHLFETVNTHRLIQVKNTDKLLDSYLQVQAGKTGFTYEAGHCFVAEITNLDGEEIYLVILGSSSRKDLWQETKILATWAFENYNL